MRLGKGKHLAIQTHKNLPKHLVLKKKKRKCTTYCMCVTVSSVFIASGFVAAVCWSWVVHEPVEQLRGIFRKVNKQSLWSVKKNTSNLVVSKIISTDTLKVTVI